jgi:hypothetical protein
MRPNPIPNKETLAMLWAYKALRVFSDRLIDDIASTTTTASTLWRHGRRLTQGADQEEQEL